MDSYVAAQKMGIKLKRGYSADPISKIHDETIKGAKQVASDGGNGIIVIGKSLGAKAKNYEVMDLPTGEMFHFVEGTGIQNVKVFAGKGSNVVYRNAYKYADRYGGKVEDWQHVKGIGLLATDDGDRQAEIHWSQCEGFGKHDFFVKKWIGD